MKQIKTPDDILKFMDNIHYGYIGSNGKIYDNTLKDVRKYYKTLSINEVLEKKIGTCIEQVYLMHYLLDKLNIKNKMFCTRIYKTDNIDENKKEDMHCFILYYDEKGVHQIEHPHGDRKGIYHFKNEEIAIEEINKIYIELFEEKERVTTEFFDVQPGLTYKEFNYYINSLDEIKNKKR